MEDHYDDLGEDLSGLGKENQIFLTDLIFEDTEYEPVDEADNFIAGIITQFPLGNPYYDNNTETIRTNDLKLSFQLLLQSGIGLDLCEICGGQARTSTVAIRRRLAVGKKFDLVTQRDLNDKSNRTMVEEYIYNRTMFFVSSWHLNGEQWDHCPI